MISARISSIEKAPKNDSGVTPTTAHSHLKEYSVTSNKAVVLLSGGLDSTTTLAIAQQLGFHIHALTFRYGQRHDVEVERAASIASAYGVAQHEIVTIDLRVFGQSALTADIPVPKHDDVEQMGSEIPVTYVPARNTIFLAYALAYAESLACNDIFIGV